MVMPSARGPSVAALALVAVFLSSVPVHAACDPATDPDRSDIAKARAAVAANCDCAGAATHGTYVSCAAQQANLVLVNKNCVGVLKRCAARSTCGKPAGAVTCCVTKTGVTKCKIKRDAAHCTGPTGSTACVGSYTSCCDACTSSGCTATTTTTLPCRYYGGPVGCAGGCAAGASCGFIGIMECGCIVPGSCEASNYPACGGTCPPGETCYAFKEFGLSFCGCGATGVACSHPSLPCNGGLACAPGLACDISNAGCFCGPQ